MEQSNILLELGEKLDELFKQKTKPDGKQYTNDEVAKAVEITPSYLSKLRRGEAGNPSYLIMLRLAWFFGVPITYFSGDAVDNVNEIDLDDRFLDAIASRASKLSTPSRLVALDLLEHIYKLESESGDGEQTK